MNRLNRRELLAMAAAGAATAACLRCLGSAATVLADATTVPSALDVGPVADFKTDGITTKWMSSDKFAVVRHNGKLYAPTAICTHKGSTIQSPDGTSFACPKHHATYDIEGNVTKPPAKRALNRYAISVDANGHVIVDKSRSFKAEQWNDPASFIKLS